MDTTTTTATTTITAATTTTTTTLKNMNYLNYEVDYCRFDLIIST